MIELHSNVREVLDELRGIEPRLEPALKRSLEATPWFLIARETGERVLRGLAQTSEEQAAASAMAETITVAAFGELGMDWTMAALQRAVVNVFDAFRGRDLPLFQFAREQLSAEIVEDWVRHAKKLTEADQNRTGQVDYDVVTRRILALLFGKSGAPGQSAAAVNLLLGKTGASGPSIMEYALAKQELAGLSDETLQTWLDAVAEAWAQVIYDALPDRIAFEWDALWSR